MNIYAYRDKTFVLICFNNMFYQRTNPDVCLFWPSKTKSGKNLIFVSVGGETLVLMYHGGILYLLKYF